MMEASAVANFFSEQLPDTSTARKTALDQFLTKGFPTPAQEAWKYTRTKVFSDQLLPAAKANSALKQNAIQHFFVEPNAYYLVCVDGVWIENLSNLPNQPGLHVAAVEIPAPKSDPNQNSFVDLNQALARECLHIEASEQVVLAEPIYVLYITASSNTASYPRTNIVLKAGAQLTVIQRHVSLVEGRAWVVDVTEINMAEHAILNFFQITDYPSDQYYVQHTDVQQSASSQLHGYVYPLEQQWFYNALVVTLNGAKAQCFLKGATLLHDAQHVDHCIRIEHCAPETQSQLDYHSVADDRARGIFNAKVVVHKDAQHVVAVQNNANILLSDRAEVDTHPEFEIYADDVQCKHGATVGALDEDALFYLEARGIDLETAKGMLLYGFIYSCFPETFPPLLRVLTQWLRARLELSDETL